MVLVLQVQPPLGSTASLKWIRNAWLQALPILSVGLDASDVMTIFYYFSNYLKAITITY